MRGRRGFTLIETTVAIALLAVIIVTILGAFSAITIATRRHQQQTTLDLVTRQEAEFIKSQAYSAAPKATPYSNIAVGGYNFSYGLELIYAHWIGVAGVVLFAVAGTLAARGVRRRTRRT